jgi:hypothetical protein
MAYYSDLEKLFKNDNGEHAASVSVNTTDQLMQIEDVLTLLDERYTLPISGKYIRQYMNDLENAQRHITAQRENVVKLLAHAQSSSLMRKLRTIIGQN